MYITIVNIYELNNSASKYIKQKHNWKFQGKIDKFRNAAVDVSLSIIDRTGGIK